jgi:hypothetical protein
LIQPPSAAMLPIRLDLAPALFVAVQPDLGQALAQQVAEEISDLLQILGLQGKPEMVIRPSTMTRPLRVTVHGVTQRYPMRLLASAPSLEPPEQAAISFIRTPAAWTSLIEAWLGRLRTAADTADPRPPEWAKDFAGWLAVTTIRLAPSCLVGDDQAAMYLGEAGSADPHRLGYTKEVLRGLLDLGVNVTARNTVLGALEVGIAAGCAPNEVVEQAFRILRGYEVRLVAHPRYLADLTASAAELSAVTDTPDNALELQLDYVAKAVRADLGFPAPRFRLVTESSIREGWMVVELHDQRGWPGRGLKPGNLLVQESARRVAQRGLPGHPMQQPYTGEEVAEVPGSARPALEAAGLQYWDSATFAAILFHLVLRRRVSDLVGPAEVEYLLEELSHEKPDLVGLATRLYTVTELTGVLRALVCEGLPIQDLRGILEQLVRHDIGLLTESDTGCSEVYNPTRVEQMTSTVRQGLNMIVSEQYVGRLDRLLALRSDREFERQACLLHSRLCASRDTPQPEATPEEGLAVDQAVDHLLDEIWDAAIQVSDARAQPVLVTSDGARWAVRHLVESEMPEMPVLATSELCPEVDVVLLPWKEDRVTVHYAVVCERVAKILSALSEPSFRTLDRGRFSFYRRSTEITVRVSVRHGHSTVVTVSARPDLSLPPDPAIFERFATRPPEAAVQILLERVEDHFRPFCSFMLLGDFLDKEELEWAISEVTNASEELETTGSVGD